MNWCQLLNSLRRRQTTISSGPRSEFQRDFDRSVFSTPVKRLQDKAQVFPLEAHDAVRTRLTHSLEHQSGDALGTDAGPLLGQFDPYPRRPVGAPRAWVDLLDAPLEHGIGSGARRRAFQPSVVAAGETFSTRNIVSTGKGLGALSGTRRLAGPRVGLGSEPRRGFCQDLPFYTQLLVLTGKAPQLLLLRTGGPVAAHPLVAFGLDHPVPDRLPGRLEFLGQRFRAIRPTRTSSTICCRVSGGYGPCGFDMIGHPPFPLQEMKCPRNRVNSR